VELFLVWSVEDWVWSYF